MRILSQDLKYDFPYEKVCIEITDSGKIFAQGDLWGAGDNYIEIARYSTEEKAKKAMEMLRKAYSTLLIIKDLGNGIEADIKPNKWDICRSEPTGIRENFYFQFPEDEEIEV